MRSKGKSSKFTAAAAVIVSTAAKRKPVVSSVHECQIRLDLYDECMSKAHSDVTRTYDCDMYLRKKEECRDFKRDPSIRSMTEIRKETRESLQREATAHGFASVTAYIKHRNEQDPKMCRIAYEQYKECLTKGYKIKGYDYDPCDLYRNNCPQFK
ncbi:uncharacterized protein LOC126725558 isoform X2 [Quercus robur]|uniref:uncharacterized protein LOC126725558 isoform X2 n=1 Tax=Quercus robur TaxID=38942 RepID=UPI002162AF2C|nr:uncharacterized protein LOC126725558 isoform X2 [Quercus robur]